MVALLAEGVDRNLATVRPVLVYLVALLAEGVDRNAAALVVLLTAAGRPPRGGRG
mgnify:CR=1 FL=1